MSDIKDILSDRGKTHGDFTDNANISEDLMEILARGPSYKLLTKVQIHALRMATHKMGRIVSGNPNEPDHWLDIAGYTNLAADRIEEPLNIIPKKPVYIVNGMNKILIPEGYRVLGKKELLGPGVRIWGGGDYWNNVNPEMHGFNPMSSCIYICPTEPT